MKVIWNTLPPKGLIRPGRNKKQANKGNMFVRFNYANIDTYFRVSLCTYLFKVMAHHER